MDYNGGNGGNGIGGELIVDGHIIPRGTLVGVNPYAVMHNEEYYPEPFVFWPERWLDEGDRKGVVMGVDGGGDG